MTARKSDQPPGNFRDPKPPGAENTTGWRLERDPRERHLALRITRAGVTTYVYTANGTIKSIGRVGTWSYAQARDEARRRDRLADQGVDWEVEAEKQRALEREAQLKALTVAELLELWEQENNATVPPLLRPSTVREYRGIYHQYIERQLGHLRVPDVTTDNLNNLHEEITKTGKVRGTPGRANRVMMFASALFSLAVRKKIIADNPARGTRRNREFEREVLLSEAQFDRLARAIPEYPSKQPRRIIQLLMLTGARRGEVAGMRWDQIDLDSGRWNKPAASTKQRKRHVVYLSEPAREILKEIRDEFETWSAKTGKPVPPLLFPMRGTRDRDLERPVHEVRHAWEWVCKRAGIEGLHLHDLRHLLATHFASAGVSLPIIGQMLGHSQVQTTARYSHLQPSVIRGHLEDYGKVAAALRGRRKGEAAEHPSTNRVAGGRPG
jgi:integrase